MVISLHASKYVNSQMNSGLSFRILSVDFLASVGIARFMLRLGGTKNSKTKQAFSTID